MTITAAIVLTGIIFGGAGMIGFAGADMSENYKVINWVAGAFGAIAFACFLTAIWYEALS